MGDLIHICKRFEEISGVEEGENRRNIFLRTEKSLDIY